MERYILLATKILIINFFKKKRRWEEKMDSSMFSLSAPLQHI